MVAKWWLFEVVSQIVCKNLVLHGTVCCTQRYTMLDVIFRNYGRITVQITVFRSPFDGPCNGKPSANSLRTNTASFLEPLLLISSLISYLRHEPLGVCSLGDAYQNILTWSKQCTAPNSALQLLRSPARTLGAFFAHKTHAT